MHCCFHFFLSNLLHFHLSPNRARELEATFCSFSVQQLLEVCRPYPQYFLSLCDEPPVVIFDHRISLHVPSILSSIPCHLEYHLFATIFVKLSVQFFLHTPPCSVRRPPGCFLLLVIHVCALSWWVVTPPVFNAFYHLPCFPLLPHCLRHLFRPPSVVSASRCTSFPPTFCHTVPQPPQRMHPTSSIHPPLFPSPRIGPHTSSLPSPCTLPSSHPCTSTT